MRRSTVLSLQSCKASWLLWSQAVYSRDFYIPDYYANTNKQVGIFAFGIVSFGTSLWRRADVIKLYFVQFAFFSCKINHLPLTTFLSFVGKAGASPSVSSFAQCRLQILKMDKQSSLVILYYIKVNEGSRCNSVVTIEIGLEQAPFFPYLNM